MNSWTAATLGDLAEFQRGFDLPVGDRKDGPYPVVAATGPVGTHHAFKVKGPGVVIGRSGTIGGGQFIEGNFWPLNTTLWVKDFKGNDPRFIYYFVRNTDFTGLNAGSSVPTLNRNHIHKISARYPTSVEEQRAIAGVLGSLDDKIEQNRRTARALERLARAIFRAWFVNFEPVRAKIAGALGFPSMPQSAFDALPNRFVKSDIGPVPDGWGVGAVSDLATLSKEQVNPQAHGEELFEHFSIPAFDAGRNPIVEPGAAIKSNKTLVVDECVLLSKLNPRIPRVWLPQPKGLLPQIASTEFLVLVPRGGYNHTYLYCQFQQREFREDIAQRASGTSNSHQRVRPGDLCQATSRSTSYGDVYRYEGVLVCCWSCHDWMFTALSRSRSR